MSNNELTLENLWKDIELLGSVMQQHDQSLFQIIASINAVQTLLIEKGIITAEEIAETTKNEAIELQKKIADIVAKEQEALQSQQEDSQQPEVAEAANS